MSLYLYLINDFLLLMWSHCQSVATGSHRVVICHISSKDMYSKAGESILIPLWTDLTKRLLPAAYPSIRFNLNERPVIEKTCKIYIDIPQLRAITLAAFTSEVIEIHAKRTQKLQCHGLSLKASSKLLDI